MIVQSSPAESVGSIDRVGIRAWLTAVGLEKYADAFLAQDVSPDLLPDLTDTDLRELGVASLGDRKRLLKAMARLATDSGVPASSPGAAPTPGVEPSAATPPAAATGELDEEGERRHATVMFSDLTGYTALNEAFDPEEVEAIMARIKQEAVQVIERHGGRVNQFVGDEVMALFGIPVARRDDPRRAVSAALELHRVVDGIAADYAQRLGRDLAMHTGVQTGLVIARRSDSRSGDYTLTGDTVNTAARLRGLAEPGQVVVSSQTWQQVSDYFEASVGKAVEVRGKERPLVPYRILAERAEPLAGSRPLVGRSDEMAQFSALAQACVQQGRGRLVLVRGDPGLGKSRLVAEFMHLALELGFACHASVVLDFGARTGHDAMRMLAQSLLGLPADADEPSRAEALQLLADSVPDGADHSVFLYDLLEVTAPADVLALLSAMEVHEQQKHTLDALCALVQPRRPGAPLLLLVEDIHWADTWTLQQLAALAALTARQPLLLVLSTRFAGDPTMAQWRDSLRGLPLASINLGPLATEDAMRIAAGSASLPQELLRSCVERAEGNPLFLEQLLLNAGNEGAASLPGSVQALIQARMDRLAPADKSALQAAAVWGPRVPVQAIRHLVGDPDFDSQALVAQFLLRPDGDALVFNHALIRDGAYASLLLTRRRQLHALAAEWVEPRDAALAGEHFERAEDSRASPAYLRAARELAVQFQYAQALVMVDRADRAATLPEQQFPVRLARARLLLETGRSAESIEACQSALLVAQSGAQRASGLIAMAAGMRILDRLAEGMELLEQAQPLAEQAGLTLERSRLHHLRGNLLFSFGRTTECQREHEEALRLARAAGSSEAEAAALGGVGDASYAQGRVRTGYEMFTRCVMVARVQMFLRVEVAYLTMVGWCSLYLMDVAGSLQACRRTIDLAVRIGHR
nr:AAA family ATPase [Rhodoferax sp.]